MIRCAQRILGALLLLVFCCTSTALSQPQSVPRLVVRPLDRASYVQLAKEWKAYIEKNGESAEALVNLGMAYHYSKENNAAVSAGKRAVELEPDNPKALAFYGKMLAVWKNDEDGALKLLEHCRTVAPDYEDGLTELAAIRLRRGELNKSKAVLKTVFDQRLISQPLQDFAYNMLIGLPHGALLITNGDNDTFPPLALQAGMNLRNDVVVINRSLLNLKAYADAVFKEHPSIKPRITIDSNSSKGHSLSKMILEKMVDEQKAPIYFASTVNFKDLSFLPEMPIEGLNLRSSKEGLSTEASARLFVEKYRMDSATDWNFAWDLIPSVSKLMTNYVSCMIRLAEQEDVRPDTKNMLLDKASKIAKFHDMAALTDAIKSLQDK